MKVLFGIATMSGRVTVQTIASLDSARKLLDREGIESDVTYLSGKSPVSSAKGDILGMFLKLQDFTDLFYIDDDEGFPAEAVLKLLKYDVKIVGGAYPIKDDNHWHYAGMLKHDKGVPIERGDGLLEAENIAGGFLRIKRIVIEKMVVAYPERRYVEYGRESYDLFSPYIEEINGVPKLWGDDYAFCNRWKAIGGQLWIDPNIDFEHIGFKNYKGNYFKYLMKVKERIDNAVSNKNGKAVQCEQTA